MTGIRNWSACATARAEVGSVCHFRMGFIRALLCSSALGAGLLPLSAFAQTTPPPRQVIDNRGVDVASGKVITAAPGIGIGDLESAETWNGSFSSPLLNGQVVPVATTRRVVLGEVTKLFVSNGSGGWSPQDADGSTLVQVSGTDDYIYTASDGTTYLFANYAPSGPAKRILLTEIGRPNAETISYSWRAEDEPCGTPGCKPTRYYRLDAISSTKGYLLKATYAGQSINVPATWLDLVKVQAINLSEEYCSPTSSGCSFTMDWAEQARNVSTSGGSTTTELTDEKGEVTTIDQTANGVTNVIQPASTGNNTTVTYDGSGQVSSVTEGGVTYNYGYSLVSGVLTTTVTAPDSSTETFVIDAATNRLNSVTNRTGNTTAYQYDGNGRVTRETLPEGNYTQWTYDARGNVTEVRKVAKSGSGLSDIVETADFDATCSNTLTCNKPNYTIDARGNRTDYTYSSTHGGVTRIQLPAATGGGTRPEINYTYTAIQAQVMNSSGVLVSSGAPQYKVTSITTCSTAATCPGTANETKITLDYNSPNLSLTSKTVAAGDGSISSTEAYTYDFRGRLATIDGPLPGSDDTTYIVSGPLDFRMGTISPDPDGSGPLKRRGVRYNYDAQRRLTKEARGSLTGTDFAALAAMTVDQEIEYTYDANGKVSKTSLKAGATTHAVQQMSYDNRGRLECAALRMNSAIFATLPPSACTLGTVGSFGEDRITKTSYDADSRVTKVETGYGVSGMAADELTTTYSANGNIATIVDAKNNKTTYSYDGFDRLLFTYYPSPSTAGASSSTDYEAYGYDAASNVTVRYLRGYHSDNTQYIAYAYDNLNRLSYKNLPGSEPDVAYTYDLINRLTLAIDASGNYTGFAFDALSRNTAQSSPLGVVGYQYDAAGRRTRLNYPGSSSLYIDYDYLVTGEVTKLRENGATSGAGVLATFAYDDLGRRTSLTRGNGTITSFGYDAVSRLSSLDQGFSGSGSDVTTTLAYNPASQIASLTRSNDAYAFPGFANVNRNDAINGLNQIATTGATGISHDSKGNISSVGSSSYTYSSENLLKAAQSSVTFGYDPMLRLYEATGASTTRFLYDGADLIGEYDASGGLLRRYVHGPGADEPLVWIEGNGAVDRRWMHADERGSIVAISDGSGASIATNSYDEYGVPASGNSGRFQYTGQAWLPEIGMFSYKTRVYNPDLGRFMQADSIGYVDGMNMYAYTGNNPVNLVDPTGMTSVAPGTCAVVTGSRIPRCGESLIAALADVGVYAYRDQRRRRDDPFSQFSGSGSNFGDIHDPFALPRIPLPDGAADIVVTGVREAMLSVFPSLSRGWLNENVVPLNSNFAQVKNLDALRDRRWKKRTSSHSSSAWEIQIPGTDYVLKLYQNDDENSGLDTIAIVYPTSHVMHWAQFPLFIRGAPVNFWNVQNYCSSTKRCR